MLNSCYSYFLLILFILISGCAHVISNDLRAKVDQSINFNEVFQNPNAYKGKIVLWGGEIIQTLPQKDGTTLIEVLQWPLGWRGEPKRTVSFHGKFLVLVKEHLDPSLYQIRERITVAGEILGEMQGDKIEHLTERAYRYPILLSQQLHLWKDSYYPYSSPPYQKKGPWEYDPSERPLRF